MVQKDVAAVRLADAVVAIYRKQAARREYVRTTLNPALSVNLNAPDPLQEEARAALAAYLGIEGDTVEMVIF